MIVNVTNGTWEGRREASLSGTIVHIMTELSQGVMLFGLVKVVGEIS
jgi:hypothetical protein